MVQETGMIQTDMIQADVRELVTYGVQTGLVQPDDVIYTTNRLLELFGLEELEEQEDLEGEGTAMEPGDQGTCLVTMHTKKGFWRRTQ